MNWRHYLLLALLGVIICGGVAFFQAWPGYLDADYYYAGGLQLVSGKGFTEPYIWNYLDDPAGLPHPSHAYWMPLASLLAAAGMFVSGCGSWISARIGFLVVAVSIPPLTASLAYSLSSRRNLAFVSGLLASFSCYYVPFLAVTDTFGIYMLLGTAFIMLAGGSVIDRGQALFLGVLAGLMHLTRADGVLWLILAFVVILSRQWRGHKLTTAVQNNRSTHPLSRFLFPYVLLLFGYLLVMSPWLVRNQVVFGSPFAPGGLRTLWLTHYDQTFTYPADQITFQSWLAAGLGAALKARIWALYLNLQNAFAVQGMVFLVPFILIGFWRFRNEMGVRLAGVAWILSLIVMTVLFPFAGARGGFFHSGAALQPMCWTLAPLGLDQVFIWVEKRGLRQPSQIRSVLLAGMVALTVLMTAVIIQARVLGPSLARPVWGQRALVYEQVEQFIAARGAQPGDVVMVANPPGYYLVNAHPAVVIPDGDLQTLLTVASRFGARFLILEPGKVTRNLQNLYTQPENHVGLYYLGEVEAARVYALEP